MNKNLIYIFCIIILIILIIVLSKGQTVETSSGITLSNETIGWGIKRNDNHKQPDLGSKNKSLIEKYNGMAMGNDSKQYIYLTFDEGYEAGYTPQILKTLKENEVKATFFLTAHFVNTQEDLVKQMIEEGHIVGNHTVNHKSMPDLTEEQIKSEVMKLHEVIKEKFNYEMKYIRPPKGEFSERTLKLTNDLGYKTVMWSFAYEDWNEDKQPSEEQAKKKIINNLHNGEIMLLHGNSKTNTNILNDIIKEAKSMGYEFKSLDEFE